MVESFSRFYKFRLLVYDDTLFIFTRYSQFHSPYNACPSCRCGFADEQSNVSFSCQNHRFSHCVCVFPHECNAICAMHYVESLTRCCRGDVTYAWLTWLYETPCCGFRNSRLWPDTPARWTRLCSPISLSSFWPSACSSLPGSSCILSMRVSQNTVWWTWRRGHTRHHEGTTE